MKTQGRGMNEEKVTSIGLDTYESDKALFFLAK